MSEVQKIKLLSDEKDGYMGPAPWSHCQRKLWKTLGKGIQRDPSTECKILPEEPSGYLFL